MGSIEPPRADLCSDSLAHQPFLGTLQRAFTALGVIFTCISRNRMADLIADCISPAADSASSTSQQPSHQQQP